MKKVLFTIFGVIAVSGLAMAQDYELVSAEDAGLTRIVPDTIIFQSELAALGNWEPYASVLGNSEFLIISNVFAEGATDLQQWGVAIQPVEGGPNNEVAAFYTDAGDPYWDIMNFSRQNGNPGRIAGDKRPGAVNYITGAEASPHALDEFNSDGRWDSGPTRAGDARFGTVQVYELDTTTLDPTPLTNAIDPVLANLTGDTSFQSQLSRFGGELVALDNGNFVVMVEDRSTLLAAGNSASAAIIRPDGTIVKEGFSIYEGDIWSNLCAFKGGFCERQGGFLFFYDNDGNFLGEAPQELDIIPDTGRGDDTRISSHINSNYVYLAGDDGIDSVRVAVYDARTFEFVTETNVNELTPELGGTDEADLITGIGRVNIAVDALDRIFVVWDISEYFAAQQCVGRVLAFNGDDNSFEYLTPTFLTFVNSGDTDSHTIVPAVAMTTKQLMVAAKGEINSSNNPADGVDTPNETNFYTVLSHPDPQDDPTPPVEGTSVPEWSIF